MSGLLGLFGGNSAKRDRSEQLDAYTDLRNVFNFSIPQAKQQTAAGASDTGAASSYWKKLLSGDRPTAMQAIAPETAAATSANDAAKRGLAASGTARGGGATAVNQQRDQDVMGKVDQLLFGARGGAASGEAALGTTESKTGLEAASIGAESAAASGKLASANRTQSQQLHNDAFSSAVTGVGDILSLFV